MSASACVVFYGLRFEIQEEEIDGIENRKDVRMVAARSAGLKAYWSKYGERRERFVLFIGTEIAVLGPEDRKEASVASAVLSGIIMSTKERLDSAGMHSDPSLHFQWLADN
jgi:hypothetical protein